jgi:hypothetical protein
MEKYTSHEWKGEFINDLVRDLGYRSYLELGVDSGTTWNQISCDVKVGVDSNPSVQMPFVIISSTDSYFASINKEVEFELIYIDAYHEKNQVKKDFFNSLSHLKRGGVIILHDINPPNKEGISIAAHGDCFAFWCQLTQEYPNNVMVFKGEGESQIKKDAVGLFFWKGEEILESSFGAMEFDYEYFAENRNKYIGNFEVDYPSIINNSAKNNT